MTTANKQHKDIFSEENFSKYFRNTRNKKKRHGEILALFQSSAVFQKGKLKEEIVDALSREFGSVNKCLGKLFKFAYASHLEGIFICKAIVKDYLDGMSREEIIKKEYPFVLQMFFYTKPDYVPKDDPRWFVFPNKSS